MMVTNHPNQYRHIYVRAYDFERRGEYWEAQQLPDWIWLEIASDGDSKQLTVHSRIHVRKAVAMNPTYCAAFTDEEIIKDLSAKIAHKFL